MGSLRYTPPIDAIHRSFPALATTKAVAQGQMWKKGSRTQRNDFYNYDVALKEEDKIA